MFVFTVIVVHAHIKNGQMHHIIQHMCSNCEPKVKLQSALNFYLSNIFVLLLLLFFFLIYLLTEKFGTLSKYTFLIVKESFFKEDKKNFRLLSAQPQHEARHLCSLKETRSII